jgi:hypothetical protein
LDLFVGIPFNDELTIKEEFLFKEKIISLMGESISYRLSQNEKTNIGSISTWKSGTSSPYIYEVQMEWRLGVQFPPKQENQTEHNCS